MHADRLSNTDEDLACQTQAGSVCAFEELVSRYEKRIYAFAVQSCPRADALEITQDTFIRAYQSINRFNANRSWATWLFAIARNRLIDHLRLKPSGPPPDLILEEPDPDDPAELLARAEDRRDMWQLARRMLPEVQYQAIWLRYVENMELAQIARVLRKTRTHVKVLLFRARQTLARHLKPPAAEPAAPLVPPVKASREALAFNLFERKVKP